MIQSLQGYLCEQLLSDSNHYLYSLSPTLHKRITLLFLGNLGLKGFYDIADSWISQFFIKHLDINQKLQILYKSYTKKDLEKSEMHVYQCPSMSHKNRKNSLRIIKKPNLSHLDFMWIPPCLEKLVVSNDGVLRVYDRFDGNHKVLQGRVIFEEITDKQEQQQEISEALSTIDCCFLNLSLIKKLQFFLNSSLRII